MNRIIALQGRANSGKTTTVKLLPNLSLANCYTHVLGKYQQHGADSLDVYKSCVHRIAVTSSDDSPQGKVAAVNRIPTHLCEFGLKPIGTSAARQSVANATDVNRLTH